MAPRKGKESLVDLCSRTTSLGNTISVRMLEYLSTVKNQPHGFRDLAATFLDVCRILCSIEAGLKEASKTRGTFPSDMLEEIDKKFHQTNDDFIVLNQMLVRFLEYEKKGRLGKLQRGFHMMFVDSDLDKMKETLRRSRDALGMSAMVFRWHLGDANVDSMVGMGYTGLAAVLDRMNPVKQMSVSVTPAMPIPSPQGPDQLPPLPPAPLEEKPSSLNLAPRLEDRGSTDRHSLQRHVSSITSSKLTPSSATRELALLSSASSPPTEVISHDNRSIKTADSFTQIEDMVHEIGIDNHSSQIMRIKADPTTVPRWTPKQTSGAGSAGLKTALLNAIKQKKHKMVEQLLDCGVPPESEMGVNLLREAVLHRDVESVRLLLLFGADPNSLDRERFTPLLTATESSFAEAAKLLTKYGADPNLPAGPEAEAPLVIAVTESRHELVKLYLTYGGDANSVTASGNTLLIKAINKNNPRTLVELMLDYGSDPNGKNAEGQTPLFEAIQCKRHDIMTLLLDHGANPNLPGPKHLLWPSTYQPKALQIMLNRGADHTKCPGIMELATSLNNMESVTILLKAGVDANVKKDGTYTPLCSAIRDNRGELVSLLLANGADPNLMASEYPAFKCVTHHRTHLLPQLVAAGADLRTPKGIVEKAVAHDNKDALLYLLDQGVNANDRNAEGHTALTTAIRENRADFVDILLANGADPAVRGQDWPVCMAVPRPEMLQRLLLATTGSNAGTGTGTHTLTGTRALKGAMEQAVVANQLESIKLLLAAGVSVEDRNGGVFSPLTTAIREDRRDIVRFLLDEAGAAVNSPGEHLPIVKALRRLRGNGNDTEIVEMLLARGADVNLMYRGWNAVLQAVENGDSRVLRMLVDRANAGVDLNVMDEDGRSVVDIVRERGWDEAVTLLLGERENDGGRDFQG